MNFAVFFGGLSMLVGSCLIVCVCKSCKRRSTRKRVLGRNCEIPPSVSLTVDHKNVETASNLNSIHKIDSSMLASKLYQGLGDSPKSRTSSKDSCDSTKGLLCHRDSLSPKVLEVPIFNSDLIKGSNSFGIIPSIYIDPVITTSSFA